MMRIFTLPIGLLRDLKKGARGLDDALAKPLFYGEDPEMHVEREEHTDQPATWKIIVSSETVWEEVALDRENLGAMGPAIAIYLVGLVESLMREHRWVIREMNVAAMLVELLARARQRAS